MVITQLRFSDFKAGRCKDTVVTDLLRFWESRNVKNLAKFCDYYQTTLNLLYVSYADLARLPNASNNMCFLNITISLYDYSLSRSTSDGYDAFSREDSDQKHQWGKKGEDSCALSMRNNVQRVLEPTTSSYYRKAHGIINSEPTCRRIQATYRPDPRTTVS
ncbi:unnamed protein product [Brassica oleracea var. botrytis]|uniref:(rape) hypothetical protein n=1 Tax=Brassica napus TaxID=3708 RepID=A0A816L0M7_BRANA|nr:unnamed protein product [Brassica napus]